MQFKVLKNIIDHFRTRPGPFFGAENVYFLELLLLLTTNIRLHKSVRGSPLENVWGGYGTKNIFMQGEINY